MLKNENSFNTASSYFSSTEKPRQNLDLLRSDVFRDTRWNSVRDMEHLYPDENSISISSIAVNGVRVADGTPVYETNSNAGRGNAGNEVHIGSELRLAWIWTEGWKARLKRTREIVEKSRCKFQVEDATISQPMPCSTIQSPRGRVANVRVRTVGTIFESPKPHRTSIFGLTVDPTRIAPNVLPPPPSILPPRPRSYYVSDSKSSQLRSQSFHTIHTRPRLSFLSDNNPDMNQKILSGRPSSIASYEPPKIFTHTMKEERIIPFSQDVVIPLSSPSPNSSEILTPLSSILSVSTTENECFTTQDKFNHSLLNKPLPPLPIVEKEERAERTMPPNDKPISSSTVFPPVCVALDSPLPHLSVSIASSTASIKIASKHSVLPTRRLYPKIIEITPKPYQISYSPGSPARKTRRHKVTKSTSEVLKFSREKSTMPRRMHGRDHLLSYQTGFPVSSARRSLTSHIQENQQHFTSFVQREGVLSRPHHSNELPMTIRPAKSTKSQTVRNGTRLKPKSIFKTPFHDSHVRSIHPSPRSGLMKRSQTSKSVSFSHVFVKG